MTEKQRKVIRFERRLKKEQRSEQKLVSHRKRYINKVYEDFSFYTGVTINRIINTIINKPTSLFNSIPKEKQNAYKDLMKYSLARCMSQKSTYSSRYCTVCDFIEKFILPLQAFKGEYEQTVAQAVSDIFVQGIETIDHTITLTENESEIDHVKLIAEALHSMHTSVLFECDYKTPENIKQYIQTKMVFISFDQIFQPLDITAFRSTLQTLLTFAHNFDDEYGYRYFITLAKSQSLRLQKALGAGDGGEILLLDYEACMRIWHALFSAGDGADLTITQELIFNSEDVNIETAEQECFHHLIQTTVTELIIKQDVLNTEVANLFTHFTLPEDSPITLQMLQLICSEIITQFCIETKKGNKIDINAITEEYVEVSKVESGILASLTFQLFTRAGTESYEATLKEMPLEQDNYQRLIQRITAIAKTCTNGAIDF